MSLRTLEALKEKEFIIHTALDDLESFLWVLVWCIVQISKGIEGAKAANRGIERMLSAWSGDVERSINKYPTAEQSWKDIVFGDLIEEWLGIFKKAKKETEQLTEDMSTMQIDDEEWVGACDKFESYCTDVYEVVLKSGFRHLGTIGKYPDWDKVVAANSQRFTRKRRFEQRD